MAAVTTVPSGVCIGLRLISTGNSEPSLRSPNNSNPTPIGRGRGDREEIITVPGVVLAITFGNEGFDFLADQFGALVAKEPLALLVYEGDTAVGVDNRHSIGRGLQKSAKIGFTTSHCFLVSLSLHGRRDDVGDGPQKADVVRTEATHRRTVCAQHSKGAIVSGDVNRDTAANFVVLQQGRENEGRVRGIVLDHDPAFGQEGISRLVFASHWKGGHSDVSRLPAESGSTK